jgi:DNA-binding response OmpR family regulator
MDSDSKIVVLVADDEPSTLAMVSSHLGSKGYEVLEASDGDQAWELAHEHLPHLVVLDVMMPGMSGWEVCRKIREAVSLAHTGVIMLTGIGENLNEMTSPLYGADAYVDKPFEFANLDRKIRDTLKRRQAGAVGRAESRGSRGSRNGEPSANGIERPTLPAAAPAPLKESKRRRVESPKPLVKAHAGAKETPARKRATKQRDEHFAKPSEKSRNSAGRGQQESPIVRKASASREPGKRTSIMKEKPRAKAPAKKPAAPAKAARAEKGSRASADKASVDMNKPTRTTKKAPAKKATAKKGAAPAAKKAPSKKAPAKKAQTAAKKAPAKKAPSKKAPTKKTQAAVKKAPTKKAKAPLAKKAPAKKAPTKKAQTVAKKAPTKKAQTAAKKAPTKKAQTVAKKAPAKNESVAMKAIRAAASAFGKLTSKPESAKPAVPAKKSAPVKLPAARKTRPSKAAAKPEPTVPAFEDDEPPTPGRANREEDDEDDDLEQSPPETDDEDQDDEDEDQDDEDEDQDDEDER